MGPFHLKFEKWDRYKHNLPLVMKGFEGWLGIRNPPLGYWCRKTFKVIGEYWGLENVATETLNQTNWSELRIQVKQNLCGFIPAIIVITDFNRGNIFLNFGDIESLDSPSILKGGLVKDFKNPVDQQRVRQALEDEDVDVSFFPPELSL